MKERFDARVTWLPFFLHPEYPPEGMPRAELRRRYGEESDDHLRELFERSGFVFNPPDVMPRSLDALRLTELARDRDLHEPFHDRLMDAAWDEGRDLGDHAALAELAREVGLPGDDVERVLAGDDYRERVEASTSEAQSIGINGIPAFLLDGRLLVLGAHPRETFERAFEQLAEAKSK
jgi:predicted DsbA family dithiol-disulfide isomerase